MYLHIKEKLIQTEYLGSSNAIFYIIGQLREIASLKSRVMIKETGKSIDSMPNVYMRQYTLSHNCEF